VPFVPGTGYVLGPLIASIYLRPRQVPGTGLAAPTQGSQWCLAGIAMVPGTWLAAVC